MVYLTQNAVKEVKSMIEKENRPQAGVRLAVRGGECCGYSYAIDLEDQEREGDQVFEADGVKVYVDEESFPLLKGSTLDYTQGMMGYNFTVKNPNAKGSCGCGSSFEV